MIRFIMACDFGSQMRQFGCDFGFAKGFYGEMRLGHLACALIY
jgi:hypothetical protein